MAHSLLDEYKFIIASFPKDKVKTIKEQISHADYPSSDIFYYRDLALCCLYFLANMSAPHIKDNFPNKFINRSYNEISWRSICTIVKKYGFSRGHLQAMHLRIIQERFKPRKRNFDYRERTQRYYRDWRYVINLNRHIRRMGLTSDSFAEKVGISRSYLNSLIAQRSKLKPTLQKEFEQILKVVDSKKLFSVKAKRHFQRVGFDKLRKGYYFINLDCELKENGYTKRNLAETLGVTQFVVSNWANKLTKISKRNIKKFTELFKKDKKDLFFYAYGVRSGYVGSGVRKMIFFNNFKEGKERLKKELSIILEK